MAYVVDTIGPDGLPWCPVDNRRVQREGEFCSSDCWDRFHYIVHEMGEVLEMNYLTLEDQPWYGVDHG